MSYTLIDGRRCREALLPELIKKVSSLTFTPVLAIIQVGDLPDSTAFIRAKRAFAKKIGIREIHIRLNSEISEEDLLARIAECNGDRNIHGIIVQLPLPSHINKDKVIGGISPKKDADGLVNKQVVPATARGIKELLNFYDISLTDKKVTVLGRSALVGTPIAEMCRREGAVVTVCHKDTDNIPEKTKNADIVISAVGKPGLVSAKHVEPGQIVIDVGITAITNADHRRLAGDADFEEVSKIVSAISPVPGGVGPMTVFALFENLIDLCISVR